MRVHTLLLDSRKSHSGFSRTHGAKHGVRRVIIEYVDQLITFAEWTPWSPLLLLLSKPPPTRSFNCIDMEVGLYMIENKLIMAVCSVQIA